MMKKAVVLLSGGLDSATCLAIARSQGFACYCLSFDYGQRHRAELAAATRVAQALGAAEQLGGAGDVGQRAAHDRDRGEVRADQVERPHGRGEERKQEAAPKQAPFRAREHAMQETPLVPARHGARLRDMKHQRMVLMRFGMSSRRALSALPEKDPLPKGPQAAEPGGQRHGCYARTKFRIAMPKNRQDSAMVV